MNSLNAVPVNDRTFDYAGISHIADGLILMNYDQHYPGGDPGAVSSQDWFVKNLQEALKGLAEIFFTDQGQRLFETGQSQAYETADSALARFHEALDLEDSLCERVAQKLRPLSVPGSWVRMVLEVVEREAEERSQLFGEALPIGLRLVESSN